MNTSKTLLSILVEELPKRVGWPDGVEKIGQDFDCELKFLCASRTGYRSDIYTEQLCAGHRAKGSVGYGETVTREQYEAALAASQDINSRANDDLLAQDVKAFHQVTISVGGDVKGGAPFDTIEAANTYASRLLNVDPNGEYDLNDCIGQTPEDLEHLTRLMVEEINYSYTDITLANAYKIASNLIDAGYRKQ